MKRFCNLLIVPVVLAMASGQSAFAESTRDMLNELRSVQTGDEATVKASKLAAKLRNATDLTLIQALEAMKGASPLGRNWLLGIANARFKAEKGKATEGLKKFLSDRTQDGEARYKVFVWLTAGNAELKSNLLSKMLDDPSPELRYEAIAAATSDEATVDKLKQLLESARHPNQVVDLVARLEKKDVKVDQQKVFGFLPKWMLIGPFDNAGTNNFDKSFPVEADWAQGNAKEQYAGKAGDVKWMEYATEEKDGNIDLATLYNKEKGCIVYAMTEFVSPSEGPAEIRLGCINGHKIWLNGKLVMSNEVFHSSSQIDQYIEPIELKKGPNRILIKICQNEQTEPWAQRFQFLVRICDSTGKAIPQAN